MKIQTQLRWNAVGGGLAWLLGCAVIRPGLAEALVALAPLVAVPLGLSLAAPAENGEHRLWRALPWLQLPAAVLLFSAFAFPPGPRAALLGLPWILVTALTALLGALRLLTRRPGSWTEISMDAGMVYLAVGGAWILFSRWGRPFLGFGEPLVLLTGAHFHYAGFVLPILAGMAGRARPAGCSRAAILGVVTGVPLVALGITLAPQGIRWVEWFAAWWMVLATVLVAVLQLQIAIRSSSAPPSFLPGVLLALSAASLLGGMALAGAYSLGRYFDWNRLDIPAMISFHATLNGLGFAVPGLLAWTFSSQAPATDAGPAASKNEAGMSLLFPWLGDEPDLKGWECRGFSPGTKSGPKEGDRRDAYERVLGMERPGEPEPDGLHRRVAASILSFDVFPETMVTPVLHRMPIEEGDTVGCRFHAVKGVDFFFAARVIARCDSLTGGAWRTGFTYRTLDGHPLAGEETFAVEKDVVTGQVRISITSWSRPEILLARAFYPVARWLQVRGGRAMLGHLARLSQEPRK
jgi:hypothetical protein